jgi:hypothetical protein
MIDINNLIQMNIRWQKKNIVESYKKIRQH